MRFAISRAAANAAPLVEHRNAYACALQFTCGD